MKKKLLIDEFNQQKNNVLEEKILTRESNVLEDSSSSTNSNYNESSRVKNILKIPTLLPLEPSLYSPIHPLTAVCFLMK